jgi:hypothetical protein
MSTMRLSALRIGAAMATMPAAATRNPARRSQRDEMDMMIHPIHLPSKVTRFHVTAPTPPPNF